MDSKEILVRYRRLATLLLSAADESDGNWAAHIIDSVRTRRNELSVGLVREAFRNRRLYRNNSESSQVIHTLLTGEHFHQNSIPLQTQLTSA